MALALPPTSTYSKSMRTTRYVLIVAALTGFTGTAFAWSNHAMVSYRALERMPELSVQVAAGKVSFVVEDGGPGVPDYALARVFERFYSLPRPGTQKKSTGLGLALVREIAHLHGGDATLENRVEGGARATLWVPESAR